ncbi:iron ABC transporter permease [Mesorhizobium sp. SB112]|uniref:ABC transporter permease n=1 Tax=Mesorhizobium sp. SB112 TaxID=3151853 RepID=UPI003265C50C
MALIAVEMAEERRRLPALLPKLEWVVLALLVVFVTGLSFAPLMRLVATAIAPGGTVDFGHVAELLWKKKVLTASVNTLFVAGLSTLLAIVLGTIAAALTVLTDMRFKSAWVFAFVLPLMIPPQVTALAWVQAFSPSSPILGVLGLSLHDGGRHPLYSPGGIVLLLGFYNAPLVFLTVRAALRRLPAELVEAARAAGAASWPLIFSIVLPLARAGLFAGAALSFVSSIGNFGIQAMLGIPARFPTLITLIYQQMNSYGPSALTDMAVLALLLCVLTILGVGINGWLGQRGDVRVDGTGRPIEMRLGRWRPVVELGNWLFLLVTMALPLSALVATSLVNGFGQELNWQNLTFVNYANALVHQVSIRRAFLTSLLLTSVCVAILIVVSLFMAYFIVWKRGLLVRLLHVFSELAYALPGIILAVAMILFFLKPLPVLGFSIYGTVWIILAAYLSSFLALALRPVLGGFAQIDRAMEEAAQVAGAGFLARMRDIIIPLVAPAAVAGGVMVFMSALNEIQVSILLVSSSVRTIGPMVVFLEEGGSSTLAAAVGCLMIVAVLLLMIAASGLSRYLPKGVLPWQN